MYDTLNVNYRNLNKYCARCTSNIAQPCATNTGKLASTRLSSFHVWAVVVVGTAVAMIQVNATMETTYAD